MSKLKNIPALVAQHYALDLRALGLMRIGLALVILADLAIRGSDLAAHYTGQGLWPRELIYNFGWKAGYWSIHTLSDSYGWLLFVFLMHAAAACMLLVGCYTRLATCIVWLLTISLHNRNLYVLQSGDDLLRLMLLWGLFLPWHARYSIDAARGRAPQQQQPLANIGYLLLIASVYFFTVSLKRSAEWHGDGSAIYYALSLDQLRLPFAGDWLYQFPGLMKCLTWLVFYIELLLPILILWPARKGYLRWVAFIFIIILHTGIGLTLYVGLFFIINMVSALGLLPAFVLDTLERWLGRQLGAVTEIKPQRQYGQWFVNCCCVMLITVSLIINLSAVHWFNYQLRQEVLSGTNALRLNQYWGMFSPSVMKTDGWFVYYGVDSVGRQWDLRLNQDYVDFAKPQHVVSMYSSDRWRKLAENMQGYSTFLRSLYCKYILKEWNKAHPAKKIATLNLYYMQKESLPGYMTTPVQKNLFCVCVND